MIKPVLNLTCGNRLKKCLKEMNISQSELSEKSGFTQQYISNIINGRRPMTVTAARSFSKTLNVLESYLLGESDYKTKQEHYKILADEITDINTCMLKLMAFNGINILRTILTSDTGETLVSDAPKLWLGSNKHLLGLHVINGIEYNITNIQYDIKICDKIYRIEASRISEICDFLNEYFKIQHSRLNSACTCMNEYPEVSE